MKLKTKIRIRRTHRYLGLFLGIQFLFWTVSGLYFSWTDLDEIHGDHFKKIPEIKAFSNLISPSEIQIDSGISSIEIREITNKPYYWINKQKLYDAYTGDIKNGINQEEALSIAKKNMKEGLKFESIEKITWKSNYCRR